MFSMFSNSPDQRLSGDPDVFPAEQIIDIAKEAIKLKQPNIWGRSIYTYQMKPLKNTPLTLLLGIYNRGLENFDNVRFTYASELIRLGADIYEYQNNHSGDTELGHYGFTTPATILVNRAGYAKSANPKKYLFAKIAFFFNNSYYPLYNTLPRQQITRRLFPLISQ